MTISIERENDGRFLASVAILPGVMAYGATEAEAQGNVTNVVHASMPARVLARWAAEDWDDVKMTASTYTYSDAETGEPIDLTEAQAAELYTWGQCDDNITGGTQCGDLRL